MPRSLFVVNVGVRFERMRRHSSPCRLKMCPDSDECAKIVETAEIGGQNATHQHGILDQQYRSQKQVQTDQQRLGGGLLVQVIHVNAERAPSQDDVEQITERGRGTDGGEEIA